VERRLAAILAIDMVGFSRLMAIDETGVLARQKEHRGKLIDPRLVEYRGRIVKTTGDGLLAEFPSVVDAFRCAVGIQLSLRDREAEAPLDHRIAYRIGVNLGDVVIEDRDIYGDGVNIVARLEKLADPGGICVSQTVVDHVRTKVASAFEDLGEQSLKNIPTAVRAYRVLMQPEMAGHAAVPPARKSAKRLLSRFKISPRRLIKNISTMGSRKISLPSCRSFPNFW
jgi:adenylate cyclase